MKYLKEEIVFQTGERDHKEDFDKNRFSSKFVFFLPMEDSNSQPLSYIPNSLATELNSSRASAGKELCFFVYKV